MDEGKAPAGDAAKSSSETPQQNHGDFTGEGGETSAVAAAPAEASNNNNSNTTHHDASTIGKSPGEVAFFKLLHSEFKKATHFFDRATEEFTIREARVREGMEIMKQPSSIMVNEKWSLLAKSIYRLYKDLLLLETFAIMTYCSFSKILKKHDKVTGYETRSAFMENIVNKANFTHYPQVLAMISRCEGLYEEVSTNLLQEGKHGLYEDERESKLELCRFANVAVHFLTILFLFLSPTGLFINMIHRLNEQVLGSSDSDVNTERNKAVQRRASSSVPAQPEKESPATSSLRNLVEENAKAHPVQVDPRHNNNGDDDSSLEENSTSADLKRPAVPTSALPQQQSPSKRQRTSVL